METATVVPTLSPSMDIQISSNFERLLFEHYSRKGPTVARVLERFRRTGTVRFGNDRWQAMRKLFEGHRFGDNATKEAIRQVYENTGELVDPHSVIGIEAARASHLPEGTQTICLATAHPAKFPAAVEEATGVYPDLPSRLAGLFERDEKFNVLSNDIEAVRAHIAGTLAEGSNL